MTNGVFWFFLLNLLQWLFFSQLGFACSGKKHEAGKSTGTTTCYLMCVLTNMDQLQITQPGCQEPHFGVWSSKTKHQLLSVIKDISDAMTIYDVEWFFLGGGWERPPQKRFMNLLNRTGCFPRSLRLVRWWRIGWEAEEGEVRNWSVTI